MTSIGTLFAFVIVCAAVMVMRKTRPDLPRPFRTPLVPVVPVLGKPQWDVPKGKWRRRAVFC